jgi:hypothetical protein
VRVVGGVSSSDTPQSLSNPQPQLLLASASRRGIARWVRRWVPDDVALDVNDDSLIATDSLIIEEREPS